MAEGVGAGLALVDLGAGGLVLPETVGGPGVGAKDAPPHAANMLQASSDADKRVRRRLMAPVSAQVT
jgi:hypothetical protein